MELRSRIHVAARGRHLACIHRVEFAGGGHIHVWQYLLLTHLVHPRGIGGRLPVHRAVHRPSFRIVLSTLSIVNQSMSMISATRCIMVAANEL